MVSFYRRSLVTAALVAAVIGVASPTFGVDITWNGLNSVSVGAGGTLSTDVDNSANWLPTSVPGAGDRAIIKFNDFHGFSPSPPASNVVVGPAAVFNPDAITYTMNSATDGASSFVINKSMTLTDLTLNSVTSNTTGDQLSRVRVSNAADVTLTLTGTNPLDATNYQALNLGWVGNGPVYQNDPGAKAPNGFRSTLNLTNAAITFLSPSQVANASNNNISVTGGGISGGSAQENDTNSNNASINFTAVGGSVTLQTIGIRQTGTLASGYAQLNVRSDQTWTADATSLLRIHHKSAGAAATVFPYMIGSITGARLDNLGQVHVYVDMMNDDFGLGTNANGRAMRIAGGTYGSVQVNTIPSGGNHTWMTLDDNVTLASTGVQTGNFAGAVPATTTPYGLTLFSGGAASTGNESSLFLNGKVLTVAQGVLLTANAVARSGTGDSAASNSADSARIDATGGTLTISGNLVYESLNQAAADSTVNGGGTGNYATRRVGVWGNASTVVNLGGNFSTNTASLSSFYSPPIVAPPSPGTPLQASANGLSQATLNLNGGASLRTFEVADASTKQDLSSDVAVPVSQSRITGGYSIGTLNVGTTAPTATANIGLVNNNVNDNAIVTPGGTATSADEKLIAGILNIAALSTLDTNGLDVLVVSSLSILPTGVLDLDSGLASGLPVLNFLGVGNQTATWNLSALQVIDSDNPGDVFLAFYDATGSITGTADRTYWQSAPIPEPASLAVLALGAAALLTRRRR